MIEMPTAPTDVTDITNLASTLEKDLPQTDLDNIHTLLTTAVEIVNMNMQIELVEVTHKYNELVTLINRGNIKAV